MAKRSCRLISPISQSVHLRRFESPRDVHVTHSTDSLKRSAARSLSSVELSSYGPYISCFLQADAPALRLGYGCLPFQYKSIYWPQLFDSRPGHVGFKVDKLALGWVFSHYPGFPCQFQ
jgi:hypothetical protein